MVLVYLTIGILSGFFAGTMAYAYSGSILLSLVAYSGAGTVALFAVLIVALAVETLKHAPSDDALMYPAE